MNAFREIKINAVVHNNRKQWTPPAIYFYDDMLENV